MSTVLPLILKSRRERNRITCGNLGSNESSLRYKLIQVNICQMEQQLKSQEKISEKHEARLLQYRESKPV